jgi:cytochrome c-type biogenesis protein CcmH/NrfF
VRRALALLLASASLAAPAAAVAAECPRTTLGDVEDEVMCPVCGTPLALATEAPQAQREREYIQRLIDDCRSKEEVKRALVAQFGDEVLSLPGDQEDDDLGDTLVYVVPAVGGLLAAGALAMAALRWRRRGERGAASVGAPAPAADARLDGDLERYEL